MNTNNEGLSAILNALRDSGKLPNMSASLTKAYTASPAFQQQLKSIRAAHQTLLESIPELSSVKAAQQAVLKTLPSRKSIYSPELLSTAAKINTSMAGVIKDLGLKSAGGNHSYITKLMKIHHVDTGHFLGQAHNKGTKSPKRKSAEEILVLLPEDSDRPKSYQLRRALVDIGVPEICEGCGQDKEWNGSELVLEVDHINGVWLDNRKENLRFLCPNCHSQQ